MNVFYNEAGIGDTLIIVLKDIELENRTFERKGDVAKIFDKETNEVAGYNIFNLSDYFMLQDKGLVKLTENLVDEINRAFQENGFEDVLKPDLSPKFVVGLVEEKEKHPDADKLSVCQVNVGEETLQIVCGAPNVDKGQKVVVAKVGAVMPSGLIIKESQLRGMDSFGMICSARELNLPDAPQEKGILVLEDSYEAGQAFFE